jgi:hypothetical protein
MPFSLLVSLPETNSEQPSTTDMTGSPSDSIYRSRSTYLPLPPPFSRSSSASSNETISSHCTSPTVVRSCKHCSFSFRSNEKQQDGLEFCSKGMRGNRIRFAYDSVWKRDVLIKTHLFSFLFKIVEYATHGSSRLRNQPHPKLVTNLLRRKRRTKKP